MPNLPISAASLPNWGLGTSFSQELLQIGQMDPLVADSIPWNTGVTTDAFSPSSSVMSSLGGLNSTMGSMLSPQSSLMGYPQMSGLGTTGTDPLTGGTSLDPATMAALGLPSTAGTTASPLSALTQIPGTTTTTATGTATTNPAAGLSGINPSVLSATGMSSSEISQLTGLLGTSGTGTSTPGAPSTSGLVSNPALMSTTPTPGFLGSVFDAMKQDLLQNPPGSQNAINIINSMRSLAGTEPDLTPYISSFLQTYQQSAASTQLTSLQQALTQAQAGSAQATQIQAQINQIQGQQQTQQAFSGIKFTGQNATALNAILTQAESGAIDPTSASGSQIISQLKSMAKTDKANASAISNLCKQISITSLQRAISTDQNIKAQVTGDQAKQLDGNISKLQDALKQAQASSDGTFKLSS